MSNSTNSARQRISSLLDQQSFMEIGAMVTARNTDFDLSQSDTPSDGVITGYGLIDGNLVYVYSQDASVLGGTIGEMHSKKIASVYQMAMKMGAPVIGLIDCAGMRLQESVDALDSFGEIYAAQVAASGVVPQISAVFGSCGGGLAAVPALSDFAYIEKEHGKVFVNSPNAVKGNHVGKCDTAGAEYQGSNTGCIDSVGTAEEILAEIRQLVCVLPGNNAECGREDECTDDLNRKCANLAGCKEDTRLALAQISDGNLFVEAKKGFAKNMVAGFIKLNGKTIGAVANATAVYDENGEKAESFEAALTARGCNKAAEFVNFCDAFDIPVLSLVNVEGFGNTECSEKNLPKAMARMTAAFAGATVPKVNVIIGNAYGSAYVMMNSKSIGADLVYAWEGSKVGMMDAALAAKIMYEGKPADVIAEKTKAYQKLQSSVETAARRGQVDLIIAPEDTRKYAAAAFEMLYTKGAGEPVKKHAAK
ncbi:MAG: carboxyl transferase [Lachnospiraceae bacterium]|jgi:acetyl-CoA carboxylase carboxyltransferase component|nr:carboxyl transferase [Lachnospiraceae bacterium]